MGRNPWLNIVGCLAWIAIPMWESTAHRYISDLEVTEHSANDLIGVPLVFTDRFVAQVNAEPNSDAPTFWTRDTITGDWGGLRTRYSEQGFDISLSHLVEVFGVVGGGLERSSAYSGSTLLSVDLYTEPLGWWEGGQFHSIVGWFEGPSVARNFAGAFNSNYFFDPTVNGITVFELWYGHTWVLAPDSTLELRIGKVYPFFQIANSASANSLSNASFRYPHFLGTIPGYGGPFLGAATAFPIAPYGIQLLYSPNAHWDFTLSVMDGFFDPSGGIDNRYGLNLDLNEREGLELIAEVAHHTTFNSLPGTYRLGFQLHTGLFDIPGTMNSRRGNYALFFVADQTLFLEADDQGRGLDAFFKLYHVPQQDLNSISWNIAAGLVYTGLLRSRPEDLTGIGLAHTVFSEGVRQFDISTDNTPRTAETVVELIYSAKLNAWWQLTGSVQYIVQPNGNSITPNVTVLGLSSRFSF